MRTLLSHIRLEVVGAVALGLALSTVGSGCRGWSSDSPPVHLNPNMDTQKKLRPYRADSFFADGRSMRPQVEGTIARGQLKNDDHRFEGKAGGVFSGAFPAGFEGTVDDVRRGQERYNIYCTPCHAKHGSGDGIVAQRLLIKPPTFHQDRLYNMPVGEIFNVITHGKNMPNMPSYAAQIPVDDRWRIALYVRALQRTTKPDLAITTSAVKAAPVFQDADNDGIADSADKCPTEAEVINGKDDDDGCPDEGESLVKISDTKIEILDKVYFDQGKATIQTRSHNLLSQVALIMKANQKIKRVEVSGHTDSTGDAAANKALSKARAGAVKTFLVGQGVFGGRLTATGYGAEKPIADNSSEAGQAKNRRVEFNVLGSGTGGAAKADVDAKPLAPLPKGLNEEQMKEHMKTTNK